MELLDRAQSPTPSSPQERLEASRAGRWLLSAFLVVVLGAITLWNMPESALREAALPVVTPLVNSTGLDQRWNLFAPNPPQRTFEVTARIEYADGSLVLWRSPRNDRWRKWLGALRTDQGRKWWEPTAAWIADHHDDGGRRAVRVELILRWRDLPPPGSPLADLPWLEELFYTYDVPEPGA